MCGIIGMISRQEISEELMIRMRDTMIHRGPDGAGIYLSDYRRVSLAHRRLSIIDLSPHALQPMSNEDGHIWTVFNGEIYNFLEIKDQLIKTGNHTWKTDHSDTEVLIHAYEEWGIEFIGRLRGQFAIAIWDDRTRELFLVRDRAGIKPIYYATTPNSFIFASEIKAITANPEVPRELDEEALYHYLSFLAPPAPLTFFKNIRKVPHGHYLHYRENKGMKIVKYYELLDNLVDLSKAGIPEMASEVLAKLKDSVSSHKISDVPIGVFLSGGIDSSTNAMLFSEGDTKPINTFTIGDEVQNESYVNENAFAKQVAVLAGASYHEKLLTVDDLLDFLPRMIYLQDEPLGDPVCVPLYYVSKLAKDNGVTVCQVGEGADEVFFGYRPWGPLLQVDRMLKTPFTGALKTLAYSTLSHSKYKYSVKTEQLRRNLAGQPISWHSAETGSDILKYQLLSPRLKKKFKGYSSWEVIKPIYDRFIEKSTDPTFMNWLMYCDLSFRMPELLLMRVDKMSMGVSVETRVPFLDHKFVEYGMSIPSDVKFKDESFKYMLKKAVRGLIPDEIIDRKKQGFGLPISEWFGKYIGEMAAREIRELAGKTDLFDHGELEKVLARQDIRTWHLLNFALWYKLNFS